MNNFKLPTIMKFLNAIDLLGISFAILIGFIFQFAFNELPCPLCLLQRLGILAIGFGFLLNIHYETKPMHYALTLLAAIFTGFVSMRQIALHIIPGSGSYGSAFLGLHLYTWVFIFSLACIIYTAIILSIPSQYDCDRTIENPIWLKRLGHVAFIIFVIALLANIVSTYFECGLQACPDNPINYHFFIWN